MLKNVVILLLGLTAAQRGPSKKGPCDDTKECVRYTFTGTEKALCFGYLSCKGATFETSANALCIGNQACKRAKFDGTQPAVLCNGMRSCVRSRGASGVAGLTSSGKVVCNGLKACNDVVGGISAPKILCDGDLTCSNYKSKIATTSLNLNGPDLVYCNGNGCCRDTQIRSDTSVYCDGDVGCKDSRIQSDEVECQGKRSCMTTILQANTVDAYGWFGAAKAQILEPTTVKAFGFNALAYANITTRGVPSVVIDMRGFRAGAGARVDCGGGSDCDIRCKGNACKGMRVDVAKNSAVVVDPAACDPADPGYKASKKDPSLPAKVAGTHCPIIVRAGRAEESSYFVQEELDYLDEVWEEMEAMEAEEEAKFEAYIAAKEEDYADVLDEDEEDDDVEDASYLKELFSFK